MTKTAKQAPTIPEDYGSLTPYVIVRGVAQLIDFLIEAFGAIERGRVPNEDGTLGHAEVWLGNRVLMMFDAKADWPDTPSFLTLYVDDCDAVYARALRAGATALTKLADSPFGYRGGRVVDPWGNVWWIQSQREDLDEADIARRLNDPHYLANLNDAGQTLDDELRRRV